MRGSIPFGGHVRNESVSVPLISEKGKCVLDGLAIRAKDLEKLKRKDQDVRSTLDKLGLAVQSLQIFFSYDPSYEVIDDSILVISFLGQSLVMYAATRQNLIAETLPVWPQGVNVSATIAVLSFHVVLLVFMLGIVLFDLVNHSHCRVFLGKEM
jgi:hypothetical protein